jgi:hypothetical protein
MLDRISALSSRVVCRIACSNAVRGGLFLVAFSALGLCPASSQTVSRWQQTEFVLGTFWDPPFDPELQQFERDSARFSLAKNAYFNLLTGTQDFVGINRTFDGVSYALRLASSVGLRYLVADDRFFPAHRKPFNRSSASVLVSQYRSLPGGSRDAMFGYNLADEPEYSMAQFRQLGAWKEFIEEKDPEKLAYYNLVASYAPSYNWGGFEVGDDKIDLDPPEQAAYERYCSLYIDSLQPRVVSFDHYPFFEDGRIRPDYFYNLDLMRRRAGSRPFWAYPMTVDHLAYVNPEASHLRFMYFCPLAYGAKGLIVFTFWQPLIKEYREAIVDVEGNPTPKYDTITELNLYVTRVLGPVVMGQPHRAIHHASRFPEQQGVYPFRPSDSHLLEEIGDSTLLVGEFGDDQITYLLIVNKSLEPIESFEITLTGGEVSVWAGPHLEECREGMTPVYKELSVERDRAREQTLLRDGPLQGGEGRLYRVTCSP